MTERRRDVLALAPLSLAALVLGHDLAFLLTFGPDYRTALIRTGHGEAWVAAVVTAAMLSMGLVVLGAARLASLRQQVEPIRPGAGSGLRLRHLLRETAGLWGLIFISAVVLFVINENLERAVSGQPLPGLGVLIGSSSLPIPALMLSAASALVAFVAALYRWRRDGLIARMRAHARVRKVGAAPTLPRATLVIDHRASIRARRLAGRAPPRLASLGATR